MHRTIAVIIAALVSAALAAGAEKVHILMPWTPQAQFVGYYLALDRGEYSRRGLDVTIHHINPRSDLEKTFEQGGYEFVVCSPDNALVIRDGGVPLRLILQVVQRSNLAVVCWKDKGIETPADLDGRRVSAWPGIFRPYVNVFYRFNGANPIYLPQAHSLALFLNRSVDACVAMVYNELYMLYSHGVDENEITVFNLAEFGADFPEDGLYASNTFIREKPEVCAAMAEATKAGWIIARDSPEEAIDAVMQRVKNAMIPANRLHQQFMLKTLVPSIFPERAKGGTPWILDPGIFAKIAYSMTTVKQLKNPVPSYEEFTWETSR